MGTRFKDALWYKATVGMLFGFSICFSLVQLCESSLHPQSGGTGHFGDPTGLTGFVELGVRLFAWCLSCLLYAVVFASGESRKSGNLLGGLGVGVGAMLGCGFVQEISKELRGRLDVEYALAISLGCAVIMVVSMAFVYTLGQQVRSFRKWINRTGNKNTE